MNPAKSPESAEGIQLLIGDGDQRYGKNDRRWHWRGHRPNLVRHGGAADRRTWSKSAAGERSSAVTLRGSESSIAGASPLGPIPYELSDMAAVTTSPGRPCRLQNAEHSQLVKAAPPRMRKPSMRYFPWRGVFFSFPLRR